MSDSTIDYRGVSVVIPTYNEKENIRILIQEITSVLRDRSEPFEILVIDDHSRDGTFEEVTSLASLYSVRSYRKRGKKGKAFSILEGVSYAIYDTIVMIDADMQYPPAAIPGMLDRLTKHDVVVANRQERKGAWIRKIFSWSFAYVFCRLLHNLPYDVQSGLKVFKKEVLARMDLHPTPWTFDMEFLLTARQAGYSIDSCDILFSPRLSGKSKVKVLAASLEIGKAAVLLKFREPEPIPFAPKTRAREGEGFHLAGRKYVPHFVMRYQDSALRSVTRRQKAWLLASTFMVGSGFVVDWHMTAIVLLGALMLLYMTDLLFYTALAFRSLTEPSHVPVTEEEVGSLRDDDLPSYTILCPLFREGTVVRQFIRAIESLDYPRHKLQVRLLLEQNDRETIDEVRTLPLPSYYEIVLVPPSVPKTKPKACNYGLRRARGTYTVIFDAEDVPEPLQLKKVVAAFSKIPDDVICLQAKLSYFNPHHNFLTKLFTVEYALWFDLVLPGLQTFEAPIPLGGTSNHFRTKELIRLKGWDAFNVTEDCDLGVRLSRFGYKTNIVDSTTLEEATSTLPNWIAQRSRWIKGYLQTYLVHMRRPRTLLKYIGWKNFLMFQLVVGGKLFTTFVNPLMWIMTISYFTFRPHIGTLIESLFPAEIFYFGVLSFVCGNFLYLYSYMMGSYRRGHYGLVKYVYMVPFYWILMSIASWKALYSFLTTPHYWPKTRHGYRLHGKPRKFPASPHTGYAAWNMNRKAVA